MGQHKHNLTAILAKEGKLPPKETKISKRERERLLYNEVQKIMPQLPIQNRYY